MNDLFKVQLPGAPLCECSLENAMQAAFENTDRHLCPQHDAAEIAANRIDAQRNDAQDDLDRRRTASDEAVLELEDERRAADLVRQNADEAAARRFLRCLNPLLASVVDATGASPVVALNDPGLARHLAGEVDARLSDPNTPTAA